MWNYFHKFGCSGKLISIKAKRFEANPQAYCRFQYHLPSASSPSQVLFCQQQCKFQAIVGRRLNLDDQCCSRSCTTSQHPCIFLFASLFQPFLDSISSKLAMRDKDNGGLGIRSTRQMNLAWMANVSWASSIILPENIAETTASMDCIMPKHPSSNAWQGLKQRSTNLSGSPKIHAALISECRWMLQRKWSIQTKLVYWEGNALAKMALKMIISSISAALWHVGPRRVPKISYNFSAG